MPLEPGRSLGHYRIVRRIGQGGMGAVFLAEDTRLDRKIALKVLPPDVAATAERLERFRREAKAVAALNHPNIVTIHSVEEAEGIPFLTMELVEGESLDRGLPAGGLPPARVLDIGIALAEALAAAHEKRIVHRDLKPANVMVTKDGRVKVLDFGLAKLAREPREGSTDAPTGSLTEAGLVVGTVPYMSPEQVNGQPLDSRTDIFSLGVVLYELATGRRPFGGSTPAETISSILRDTPRPVTEARLGRIIEHCLQKEPRERFQTARDVANELRALSREAPPRPRRLWPFAGAAVLIVAVAAAALWLGTRDGKPETPGNPSLAVLPFHNLSAEPDNDYFAVGMTEEIIGKLSRIDHLDVAARGSVAAFTDRARDVREIGRVLNTRYVLDGSVRRAGDRVRISTQLVDGETGRIVWSEDFDGTLDDVFAVQERTATQIAERLHVELSPEERRDLSKVGTENAAAYDAYLRGMALGREWGSRDSLERAIEEFQRALDLDPRYAAALAGMASTEGELYRDFDSSEERIRRAEQLAQRAIDLDPTVPDASHALALIAGFRYDYERAVKLLRETLRLAPKEAKYWEDLAWALAYQTPPDGQGAVDAARKAIELQPNFPGAYYQLGRGLLALGRNEEARAAFETMLEQDPDFGARDIGMAQYYLAVGDYDKALAATEDNPGRASAMKSYFRAASLAASGRADEALTALHDALESGFGDFTALRTSPYFASLREDPRFEELVGRYRK